MLHMSRHARCIYDRTVGSDKEIFMRLFPVQYIEAEKNRLKTISFPFSTFMMSEKVKKGRM